MATERQKLFLQMMTSLFQAEQSVADLFFKNRLKEEIEQTLDRHIQYLACQSKETQQEYIRSLKGADKFLQEIIYVEKGDVVQLAIARERVLEYLHDFFRGIVNTKHTSTEIEMMVKSAEPAPRSLVSNIPVIKKTIRGKGRLTETQENILEFVRREPECRTKDIVNQFSALSQRTVKRGLKELSEDGKIIKKIEGGAVYYSVA